MAGGPAGVLNEQHVEAEGVVETLLRQTTSADSQDISAVGTKLTFTDLGGDLSYRVGSTVRFAQVGSVDTEYMILRTEVYDPDQSITTDYVGVVERSVGSATGITEWVVSLESDAPIGLDLYQMSGLRVTVNADDSNHDIDISSGAVRDSTDTIDLVLGSALTKQLDALWAAGTDAGACVQTAALAGTVSSSSVDVTGTGTAFTTDFQTASVGSLADLQDQAAAGGDYAFVNYLDRSIISLLSNDIGRDVAIVSNDTTMTTGHNLSASSSSYARGGTCTGLAAAAYGICIIRKDEDGSVDVCASSFTATGLPDLPDGYTYFRVIARANIVEGVLAPSNSTGRIVIQPLVANAVVFNQSTPTTTQGDIIIHGADGPARLAVGTSTQVLTSDGTKPTWATALPNGVTATTQSAGDNSTKVATTAYVDAAASGGPLEVDSDSFPAAATLDVAIPDGYGDIILSWDGVSFDTGTRSLQIQVFTDGGTSPDSTAGHYLAMNVNAAGSVAVNSAATLWVGANLTAVQTTSGSLVIGGYGTSGFKQCNGIGTDTTNRMASAVYLQTAAITNIRFLLSGSGNFDAGTYVVSVK